MAVNPNRRRQQPYPMIPMTFSSDKGDWAPTSNGNSGQSFWRQALQFRQPFSGDGGIQEQQGGPNVGN
ncbi:unnamed protein product [Cuscuta campestris]|uniref:Uncharacterized protein n=1 Tax=Cuscuta campestris TaxID=132261 RepID=A0A484KG72_9ASTE|nr:unnamed protein product [Cuscuta campestris]